MVYLLDLKDSGMKVAAYNHLLVVSIFELLGIIMHSASVEPDGCQVGACSSSAASFRTAVTYWPTQLTALTRARDPRVFRRTLEAV